MDINHYLRVMGDWFLKSGIKIFFIIILTLVLFKGSQILADRFFTVVSRRKRRDDDEFKKRTDTLSSILRYLFNIGIMSIAVAMILGELGIEIGPILAAAGVLGLAVGFGAQSLVKDIISGFFIFLEDQIRVGDWVEIAGKSGVVERLNLKLTILRDLAGNVHFVPNGEISVVTNKTKVYSRYVFDIGVAYREDVDDVMDVMRQVDEDLRNDPEYGPLILEPLEIFGLDQFADSALIIKARTTTKTRKQWHVAREFNRRLKKKFDELDIEIPFPHQTVYMGQDKQGHSAPLNIAMEENKQ